MCENLRRLNLCEVHGIMIRESLAKPARLAPLVAASLILNGLLCVIPHAENSASGANEPALAAIISDKANLSGDEYIARLQSLHDDAAISAKERKEVAYVLARALHKRLQSGDASKSGANTADAAKNIYELLEEASGIAPLFERCQWQMCEVAQKFADEPAIRSSLNSIISHTQSKKTKLLAQYALAQSYQRAGEQEGANAIFLTIRKEHAGTPQYLGSGYYLAENLLKAKAGEPLQEEEIEEVSSYLREYLKESPNGKFATSIVSRMDQLARDKVITLTKSDRETFGQVYFGNGRWADAIAQWELAGPEVRPFSKSICLTNLKRYDEAKQALLNGIKLNPESRNYVNAATQLANPLTREQTTQLWRDILKLNPKHLDAPLWHIATRVGSAEAAPLFNRLLKNTPTSEFAPESMWWLFWNDVKEGNKASYARSVELANTAITRYPKTKAAGRLAFWAGRIYERMGNKDLAKKSYKIAFEQFPNTYYGYRARHRLQALSGGGDEGWSTKPGRAHPNAAWSWPVPKLFSNDGTELAEKYGAEFAVLARLGQYDECIEILPPTASSTVKSWLYSKDGMYLSAIGAAGRGLDGRPDREPAWQMTYPLAFGAFVARNAADKSVDPLLVHALMREESRYNHKAVSRSNALGLMQLMPGTAYGVAKRIGVPLNSQQDILTPEINIKLGTDYLSYAIRRFDGNCLLAVASYNGGPGAVQTWMKRHGASADFDTFVENIPYRETRDYVRKVFGSYWAYEQIYSSP